MDKILGEIQNELSMLFIKENITEFDHIKQLQVLYKLKHNEKKNFKDHIKHDLYDAMINTLENIINYS